MQFYQSNGMVNNNYDTFLVNYTVPADGFYDVTGNAYATSVGGYIQIYIGGELQSSTDCYNADATTVSTYVKLPLEITKEPVFLKAGTQQMKIILEPSEKNPAEKVTAHAFISDFTFSPAETQINPNVSFVQTTNVEGHNSISVQSVDRGASVALTAHKENIYGYKFVGWRRGADEENMDTWVKIGGDTYDVWTNTYLTAIYEPITDDADKVVEFWNQNGAYLGSATEETYAVDVTRVPSLTGFGTFLGWFTDGNVKLTADTQLSAGTTNAVAQYEDGAVSGAKRENVAVKDADVYNKAITFEKKNSASTCWKRDEQIVSYDDTYTYYVWGATNITEGTEEVVDKTPVGILEYSETYDAYMLEYDDGDYEIVEAGIIFGDGSQTIDSCDKKYTSQRKVSHNQFTAPEQSGKDAIGYIIWKDNAGGYNVKYIAE